MVVIVATAGIGVAQGPQRFFRRHPLRGSEYHQANVHSADVLFAINDKSDGPSVTQRRTGRRQPENLLANPGLAVRVRVDVSGVAANQAANLEMAQRAQSIKGLGLYL